MIQAFQNIKRNSFETCLTAEQNCSQGHAHMRRRSVKPTLAKATLACCHLPRHRTSAIVAMSGETPVFLEGLMFALKRGHTTQIRVAVPTATVDHRVFA